MMNRVWYIVTDVDRLPSGLPASPTVRPLVEKSRPPDPLGPARPCNVWCSSVSVSETFPVSIMVEVVVTTGGGGGEWLCDGLLLGCAVSWCWDDVVVLPMV